MPISPPHGCDCRALRLPCLAPGETCDREGLRSRMAGVDKVDAIVAAILAAAMHWGKSVDDEEYSRSVDLFLAMMKARAGQQSRDSAAPLDVPMRAPTHGSAVALDSRRLRELSDSMQWEEGAALLNGVDLHGELPPDVQYYAGVCLGSIGREPEAIELLKRAAAGGFGRFWCAYHLGLFEEKCGNASWAAYYYTVSLILSPERTDL